MAKSIKFASAADEGKSEEQRCIQISDTVETVDEVRIQDLLIELAVQDEDIVNANLRRDAIIDQLSALKTALDLKVVVPAKKKNP